MFEQVVVYGKHPENSEYWANRQCQGRWYVISVLCHKTFSMHCGSYEKILGLFRILHANE